MKIWKQKICPLSLKRDKLESMKETVVFKFLENKGGPNDKGACVLQRSPWNLSFTKKGNFLWIKKRDKSSSLSFPHFFLQNFHIITPPTIFTLETSRSPFSHRTIQPASPLYTKTPTFHCYHFFTHTSQAHHPTFLPSFTLTSTISELSPSF